MTNHPKKERTLVVIKPDGIQRTLIGEIVSRFEKIGFKLVAVKMFVPDKKFVEEHYTLDPDWRKVTGEKNIKSYQDRGETPWTTDPYEVTDRVLKNLQDYLTSGPIIAMVWEGAHVVELVRKLAGNTEPRKSDVGTIRGDYVLDSYTMADKEGRAIRNLIHASGSVEEAEKEILHWFSPKELINYRLVQEEILYDVNLDGILE